MINEFQKAYTEHGYSEFDRIFKKEKVMPKKKPIKVRKPTKKPKKVYGK